MFAWLKKRKENAVKKLLFQNGAAAEQVAAFYASHGNPTLAAEMNRLRDLNKQLLSVFNDARKLSSDHLGVLIAINEELRRQDHHVSKSALHFDGAYEPPGGWRTYYDGFFPDVKT